MLTYTLYGLVVCNVRKKNTATWEEGIYAQKLHFSIGLLTVLLVYKTRPKT